jgi:methionine aminotransferase
MLNSKLSQFGTTIFTVMSKLANDHEAINLSQGFPDFDGPKLLRDRVAWHMNNGHNQYSPLAGIPDLCEAIAGKVGFLYGCDIDSAREITVTPGATEAIFCAVTALVHPGDEVIIFDPAYDTYEPSVILNGGITHRIALQYPDFRIDWQMVEDCISDRTRLIILNTPHNPTGTIWDESDIDALRSLIRNRDIYLLSDEVYEHIVFEHREHVSLLRYPDLRERAYVISSFGKTYHATGWRIGYCIAPPAMTTEFLRVHQFVNFSTNAPLQYAIADFLDQCPEHHLELAQFYQPRRDLFSRLLESTRFSHQPSRGTYFQLADYSAISDLPDTEFAHWMTVEKGVASIPVSVFYRDPPEQKVIRFCFAKDESTLRRAGEILAAI